MKLEVTLLLLLMTSGVAAAAVSAKGERIMKAKTVSIEGFTIIGIEARTTNAKESSGQGIIGKQWDRFMKEGLLNQISDRIDSNIVAMYTDYESDRNGEYSFVLGAKVKAASQIPPGMVAKKVPSGRFAFFTTETGPVWKVVPETWKAIWDLPKTAPGGDRAYQADFEIYDQRASDPNRSQVDVYVGIK